MPVVRRMLAVFVVLIAVSGQADFWVSVGSFGAIENAVRAGEQARDRTGEFFQVVSVETPAGVRYRVALGPFATRADARARAVRLDDLDLSTWVFERDTGIAPAPAQSVAEQTVVAEPRGEPTAVAPPAPREALDETPPAAPEAPPGFILNRLHREPSMAAATEKTELPATATGERLRWWSSASALQAFGTTAFKAQQSEIRLLGGADYTFGRGWSITASARARFDNEDRLEPGEPRLRAIEPFTRRYQFDESTDAELRELYVQYRTDWGRIRFGKQAIVWGYADGLKVLDRVNPQSFREFILDDFDASRIPLWALETTFSVGPGELQAFVIPELSYHDIPVDGLFALTASPYDFPADAVLGRPIRRDDDRLRGGEAGMQYAWRAFDWDWTANWLHHLGDWPALRRRTLDDGAVVIEPRYERTNSVGASGVKAYGDYTIRFEALVATDDYFAAPGTNSHLVRSASFQSVVGVDWRGLPRTLVSMQLFQTTLRENDELARRNQTEMNATLRLRRAFGDTMRAEIMAIHGLSGQGALLRPRVEIDLTEELRLDIFGDFFEGSETGFYGQFNDLDRVGLALVWDIRP